MSTETGRASFTGLEVVDSDLGFTLCTTTRLPGVQEGSQTPSSATLEPVGLRGLNRPHLERLPVGRRTFAPGSHLAGVSRPSASRLSVRGSLRGGPIGGDPGREIAALTEFPAASRSRRIGCPYTDTVITRSIAGSAIGGSCRPRRRVPHRREVVSGRRSSDAVRPVDKHRRTGQTSHPHPDRRHTSPTEGDTEGDKGTRL